MNEMTDFAMFLFDVVFDEGGGDKGGDKGGDTGDKGGDDKGGDDKGGDDKGGDDKKFSQEDVNKMLAKDRKKNADALLDIRRKAGDSETEIENLRKELQSRLDESASKEDKLKRELNTLQSSSNKKISEITLERDTWKKRHCDKLIDSSLTDAAIKAEAFKPAQVVQILRGQAITEEVNGEVSVFITCQQVENGKTVTIKRTPEEAVKLMSEQVDEYGNLFKSNLKGGLGNNQNIKGAGKVESLADYKAQRTKKGAK